MLALALLLAAAVPRYDLRPGDRLVYRQELVREVQGKDVDVASTFRWTTTLVVAGETNGLARIGIQRTREAADLLRYREKGKDQLAEQRQALATELRDQPAAFTETNAVDGDGRAHLPWRALREAQSHVLLVVHEVMPLPGHAPTAGETWRGDDDLGLAYRLDGQEDVGGESCLKVAGTAQQDVLHVRFWFCPASGTVARVEMDASYDVPPAARARETLRVERVETARGETPEAWLASPAARGALLEALLVAPRPTVGAESLFARLPGADPALQRQVLAVAWRHQLRPPGAAVLDPLLASTDPRVRTLAARLATLLPAEEGGPLLQRAARDEDPFVREVARPAAPADAALTAVARAVREPGPLPAWTPAAPDWAARALASQRVVPDVPGTTLRAMSTGRFAGRRYLMRLPEEDRGDRPLPVLIVLAGGAGRALSGAFTAGDAVDRTGYLVLYPEALGSWWDDEPAAAVEALLREVMARRDVDTNRVYLTGFSNGGTGTFVYAARWPERLAAAAALEGGGVPYFGSDPPSVVNAASVPFLLLHGSDDPVIPPSSTETTARLLRDAHGTVEAAVLPGRVHDVYLGSDDGRVLAFFAAHVREPFPRRLVVEARGHQRNRFVEVLETDGRDGHVEATIGDDRTVVVTTKRVKRLRLRLRSELFGGPGPVKVLLDGRPAWEGTVTDDGAALLASWRETGDPFLASSQDVDLSAGKR